MLDYVRTTDGQHLPIGQIGVVDPSMGSATPVDQAQLEECRRWFAQAKACSESKVNSFWLQHFIQHWSGANLSNGAVILAAHQLGFSIGREPGEQSNNVTIGVSLDCIDEFDCGCGHP
jgi:hypothetical protein